MIPQEILKKVRHIEIRTRHKVSDMFAGQYHSAFKGQGMEFQEVRPYIPGDDIRDIDWNVTARTQEPYVKKFTEERELTVMLVVDISGSLQFGSTATQKKDIAAEIAAILAFSAIQNSDRVGLILHTSEVEHYIPPNKGIRHVLRVVRDVLNSEPEHKGSALQPVLDFINKLKLRRSVLFFIGDFQMPMDYTRALTITGRRHDVASVIIGDRREASWPKVGLVEWQDAETGERILVDTSHNPTRLALSKRFSRQREELVSRLRRSEIDTIEVNASEPYEKEFIRFFRERANRRRT